MRAHWGLKMVAKAKPSATNMATTAKPGNDTLTLPAASGALTLVAVHPTAAPTTSRVMSTPVALVTPPMVIGSCVLVTEGGGGHGDTVSGAGGMVPAGGAAAAGAAQPGSSSSALAENFLGSSTGFGMGTFSTTAHRKPTSEPLCVL